MLAMPDAVIFDLDGTLFDTEPIWMASWPVAFGAQGLEVLPGVIDACMGTARDQLLAIVDEWYHGDPRARQAALDHYDVAREGLLAGAPMKPGAKELLALLGERGVPCAVASSSASDLVHAHLARAGIEDSFATVVCGDEVERSKPAPDIFLMAADLLGVDPARAMVVEDSPNGVAAGRAGGFFVVLVPDVVEPGDETLAACDVRVSSLLELRDLLA